MTKPIADILAEKPQARPRIWLMSTYRAPYGTVRA
jgi:hypothetical protein